MVSSCAQADGELTCIVMKESNRDVIDIDTNGRTEERIPGTGQESWLDTTLLAMYPNIHVALGQCSYRNL